MGLLYIIGILNYCMCLLPFLKWSSTVSSLGIVQWDFTRRDHPGNPGRVSGSGLVTEPHFDEFLGPMRSKFDYAYFNEICSSRSVVYPEI